MIRIKDNIFFTQKEFRSLCIAILVFNLGYGILLPIFPLFTEKVGFTTVLIGLMVTIYAAAKTVVQIPAGFLIDCWGDKRTLLICLPILGLCFVGYTMFTTPVMYIIIRVLEGIAAGVALPAIYSILSRTIDDNKRGESMGTFSAVASIGAALGPMLSGLIMAINNQYKISFYVAACGTVFVAFLVYRNITSTNEKVSSQSQYVKVSLKQDIIYLVDNNILKQILALGVIAFLGDFIFGGISTILPLYGIDILKTSSSYISFLFSLSFITFTIFGPFAGRLNDAIGSKRQIRSSIGLIILAFFSLTFVRSAILFTIIIFIEFLGAAFMYPSMQATASKVGSENNMSGKLFGFIGTMQSIGLICGPLIAAFIYKQLPRYFFAVLSIVSIVVLVLFIMLSITKRESKETRVNMQI